MIGTPLPLLDARGLLAPGAVVPGTESAGRKMIDAAASGRGVPGPFGVRAAVGPYPVAGEATQVVEGPVEDIEIHWPVDARCTTFAAAILPDRPIGPVIGDGGTRSARVLRVPERIPAEVRRVDEIAPVVPARVDDGPLARALLDSIDPLMDPEGVVG